MALSHASVAERWAGQARSGPCTLKMEASRVFAEGDRIFSYGHFEMARLVRDGRGKVKFALVNGDRYFTDARQSGQSRAWTMGGAVD